MSCEDGSIALLRLLCVPCRRVQDSILSFHVSEDGQVDTAKLVVSLVNDFGAVASSASVERMPGGGNLSPCWFRVGVTVVVVAR
jgi:hypothetical protein